MTEAVLAAALLGVVALHLWTVYQHNQERKDLLARIMARDLSEYQAVTSSRPPPKSSNFIVRGMKKHYEAVREDARND